MSCRMSILNDAEELVPQVTSADPNERKLARRLRIERRIEALKKTKLSQIIQSENEQEFDGSCLMVTEDVVQDDNIQIQLKRSAEILEKFLIEGEEYITNVRVANDSREVDRRESEGTNREKVYEKLDEEARAANELFQKIANKWTTIQRQNDPLNINDSIIEQKEKCDALISQKDAIIAMLNNELKKADRQFTKDQKKQIEDINTLSQRVEKQISFMRSAYRDELNILEEVIVNERKVLIESSDKKWDDLFRKRETQEVSNMNTKSAQVEEFNEKMETLRIDFQENYRETKIQLESNIQELHSELQRIKHLAMLNSEKLDYNYQILKKREDENIIIKSQQKRRMNKLQDIINSLRNEISDYETSTSNKIKKLTDNIKKLHKSIVDIEAKADHFAHVNDEKFHKLWEMNRIRSMDVLKRILDTDKILYEQHMGLDWDPPQNFVIDKRTLPSYRLAVSTVDPGFLHDIVIINKTLKPTKMACSITGTCSPVNSDSFLRNTKVLKHILKRISDKSGFLTEKRLNELLKGYTDSQKDLVKMENVFVAIGIQSISYMKILMDHFMPYTFCPICQHSNITTTSRTESKTSNVSQISKISRFVQEASTLFIPELDNVINAIRQPDTILTSIISHLVSVEDIVEDQGTSSASSEDQPIDEKCGVTDVDEYFSEKFIDKVKPALRKRASTTKINEIMACQHHHPLVISPVYVLRALREFVASYYIGRVGALSTRERLDRKRLTISRILTDHDISGYWERFKLNFGEDRVRVWNGLLVGLKKYHEILKDRRTICDDVLKLRKENSELKRLLANYLDHHELMPAPCSQQRSVF